MFNPNDPEYKKYTQKKIKPLIPIFAKASIGDFSENVPISNEEDEFTELYTGVQVMLEVIRDVLHDLEAAKARDTAIINNIGEGLIVTDEEGKIIFMNAVAEKILQIPSNVAVTNHLVDVLPMEDEKNNMIPLEKRPYTLAIKSGRKISAVYYYKRPDGSRFPARMTVTPLIINKVVVGSVEIFRDISQEKEIDRMKDEFIAIVSHELKTPLTSIKVFTHLLQSKYVKSGDARAALLFSKMETQLNKLGTLTSDLLDVTKIETGKLKFEQSFFDFNELVLEVVEEVQRTTESHKLEKKLEKTKTIKGNRDRIGQVLINLLSNAIKYSPEAGRVEITSKVNDKQIEVCVRDFGVGIPINKQKHLFERYFRVEDKKHSTFPGMGLGLYISSEIIKRHEGTIWAESKEGEGSKFCFPLPLTK